MADTTPETFAKAINGMNQKAAEIAKNQADTYKSKNFLTFSEPKGKGNRPDSKQRKKE